MSAADRIQNPQLTRRPDNFPVLSKPKTKTKIMKTIQPINRRIIAGLRWHAAGVMLAAALTITSAHAVSYDNVLFTDNFLTTLTPNAETSDLDNNIGLAGGRQGGSLVVNIVPTGFGWTAYGPGAGSGNGNPGWDLRAQTGFPAAGAVNPYTMRFRHTTAGTWSTASPNINFSPFIIADSYRIEAQVIHFHLDPTAINDRWAAVSFGSDPLNRFPAFLQNAGVILFPSGNYQVFSDGVNLATGLITMPANGVVNVDLQVLNNIGSLSLNGTQVETGLDFSATTFSWFGLTGLAGTTLNANTQYRFDNISVATVPEPSGLVLAGLGMAAWLFGRLRQRS
jgi:hypothetical protein